MVTDLVSRIVPNRGDITFKQESDIGPDGNYAKSYSRKAVESAANTLYEKLLRPPVRYTGGVLGIGDSTAANRGKKTKEFIEDKILKPSARYALEDVISPTGRYIGGTLGIGHSIAAERGNAARQALVYTAKATGHGTVSAGKFYRRNWKATVPLTIALGSAGFIIVSVGDLQGYAYTASGASMPPLVAWAVSKLS